MADRENNEYELNGDFDYLGTFDVDEDDDVFEVEPYEIDIDYMEIYSKAKQEIDVMQKRLEEKEAELAAHQHEVMQKQENGKNNAVNSVNISKPAKFNKLSTVVFGGALVFIIGVSLISVNVVKPAMAYSKACSNLNHEKYDDAIATFTSLGDYKNSQRLLLDCKYEKATQLFENGEYNQAVVLFSELDGYKDSKRKVTQLIGAKTDSIAVGAKHSVAVKSIGRVVASGDNSFGQCDVEAWNGITGVTCGLNHTVGLMENGQVVATGDNRYKQCEVESWTDVVAVQAGDTFTVGLKADGTLCVAGYVGGNVTLKAYNSMTNVTKISSGNTRTACILNDGSVMVLGNGNNSAEIPALRGAVDIACGKDFISAVNAEGKLLLSGKRIENEIANIKYISAGGNKLYIVDKNRRIYPTDESLNEFEEAIMVAVGENHSIALMFDGSVKAVGNNDNGQCNVNSWGDIMLGEVK